MKTQQTPVDQHAREQALDITRSFIVQAPAGSGKTQLLTQRFLRLLAHVKQPEEIVAITFTKKAAAEMQNRIISALTQKKRPVLPHEKVMQTLAQAVLARDKACGWALLQNPNRLQIMTIDSFCLKLVRQTPVLSELNNRDQISDHAFQLYEQAVSQILIEIDSDEPFKQAIVTLLTHLDNRLDTLTNLLATLLSRREQWLNLILHIHGLPAQRQALEASLQQVVQNAVDHVNQQIPEDEKQNLLTIYQFASQHHHMLLPRETWPTTDIENWPFWHSLVDFLLTKEGTWRRQVNKNNGFPPHDSADNPTDKAQYKIQKKEMLALLNRLTEYPRFLAALITLKKAPSRQYTDQQWDVIAALLQLLPLLAAQLKITFSQTHTIDYNELSLGAIQALTDDQAPTDLSLLLDYQLQHILIDEFQDTSITQFKLLSALTAGWCPNDGKSLFLVGDPMQSIYRFRQANVGLFLKAKREGINAIALDYLQLTVNFRSSPAVIDWVNQCFDQLFPAFEDQYQGAITYAPSYPAKTQQADDGVQSHLIVKQTALNAPCSQTAHIIQLIQDCQKRDPKTQIGILVRARSHLSNLLPTLRAKQIAFSAVEIESLNQQPVIQDLLSLTYALLYPYDKVAWLGLLRAPFCGLSLIELTALITDHKDASVLECITVPPPHFHDNTRFMRVRNTLLYAWQRRYEKPLHTTIYGLWVALGGPAAYQIHNIMEQAQTFFTALRQNSIAGRLISRQLFEKTLEKLYAIPDLNAQVNVHIMTMHKAKGLEFDVVILPFLEKSPPPPKTQLLQWDYKISEYNIDEILLAPVKKTQDSQADPTYAYLQYQERTRNEYETIRLLYVGATRAKQILHLVGSVEYDEKKQAIIPPKKNSLLSKLYDNIDHDQLIQQESILLQNKNLNTKKNNILMRLPETWQPPMTFSLTPLDNHAGNRPERTAIFETAIGTVIHHCLESIATDGLSVWDAKNLADYSPLWQQQLHGLCVPISQFKQAIQMIHQAISRTLADPKGRWILSHHTAAANELALSGTQDKGVQNYVIDRTFIDEQDQCWIIDYKSSQPDCIQGDLNGWLQSQKQLYAEKLQDYAKLLAKTKRGKNIHIGLYFPCFSGWITWQAR